MHLKRDGMLLFTRGHTRNFFFVCSNTWRDKICTGKITNPGDIFTTEIEMGGKLREQKMLKGHLPRVIYITNFTTIRRIYLNGNSVLLLALESLDPIPEIPQLNREDYRNPPDESI